MDAKFLTMLERMEKQSREDKGKESDRLILMTCEITEYAMSEGFFKEGVTTNDPEATDEDVAYGAHMAAHLLRQHLGEEVKSVCEMAREEQLTIIKRADPIFEEMSKFFNIPMPQPKKPGLH